MVRRWLRIFCVVGLVVIVGMAVVGHLGLHGLVVMKTGIFAFPSGVDVAHIEFDASSPWYFGTGIWTLKTLIFLPQYRSWNLLLSVPYWFLLATWGPLTMLVWLLTRRRKVGRAFPVEVADGSARSE